MLLTRCHKDYIGHSAIYFYVLISTPYSYGCYPAVVAEWSKTLISQIQVESREKE